MQGRSKRHSKNVSFGKYKKDLFQDFQSKLFHCEEGQSEISVSLLISFPPSTEK